jgi:hypothetical protein
MDMMHYNERVMEVANRYIPCRESGDYVLYIGDPLKIEKIRKVY